MAQTSINIRMDAELKKQFEAFCTDVGMSMTTAFNIFAKKAVRENRIPFEVGGEIPNEKTRRAIEISLGSMSGRALPLKAPKREERSGAC